MVTKTISFSLLVLVAFATISSVSGHGRFIKPPNRSSVWRVPEFAGQNPPPNYSDNELYCGQVFQAENPGLDCGVCGDPLSAARPRANEHGGTYGRGIVTGTYSAGQVIDVEVDITAPHKGFMEWRLCPDRNNEAQQSCFDQHLLQLEGGGTRVPVDKRGIYSARLRLPDGVRCSECVIQWNYRTGNRWGECDDGTTGSGCGPQETFRGCSDVKIL